MTTADDPTLGGLQDEVQITNERTTKLRLQRAKVKATTRLVLRGFAGQPLSGVNVALTEAGETTTLVTSLKGSLELAIAGADTLTLRVEAPGDAPAVDVPVEVLPLAGVETSAGALARLRNLGYFAGDLPGEASGADEDPWAARSAIEEFQCDEGLAVTGEVDPDTQARLTKVHGS
jgi:hypothetical protein